VDRGAQLMQIGSGPAAKEHGLRRRQRLQTASGIW
jgi:hypothetical protein